MPHLRIVDDALWQAARARQQEIARLFEATTIGVREAGEADACCQTFCLALVRPSHLRVL